VGPVGGPASCAAVRVAEAKQVSGAWWSDFREMVTDLFPTTFRATLWHQDFEGSKGFHQTGRPFFRTPNTVLQGRHSYT